MRKVKGREPKLRARTRAYTSIHGEYSGGFRPELDETLKQQSAPRKRGNVRRKLGLNLADKLNQIKEIKRYNGRNHEQE